MANTNIWEIKSIGSSPIVCSTSHFGHRRIQFGPAFSGIRRRTGELNLHNDL
ncbi:MAG: hypothetical protein KDB79_13995 [Acidobacteria bacterium]|nr:hypothetical protein [Acidobacteriota bacterium]